MQLVPGAKVRSTLKASIETVDILNLPVYSQVIYLVILFSLSLACTLGNHENHVPLSINASVRSEMNYFSSIIGAKYEHRRTQCTISKNLFLNHFLSVLWTEKQS